MLDVATGTVETIDTGQPYYFDWSSMAPGLPPIGSDRLDLIDPATGDLTPLGQTPGDFQAPEWHPDGSRLVAVLRRSRRGRRLSPRPGSPAGQPAAGSARCRQRRIRRAGHWCGGLAISLPAGI